MTEEIETIPDDLVQNWPEEIQEQLLQAITEFLPTSQYMIKKKPVECEDIVISGSRVLGGYRPTSDIDAVAYISNYTPPQLPGRAYFRHRDVMRFRNVKVDVWLRCPDDKVLGIFPGHPDAPTEAGWRLPYYSLMTKSVEQVYPDEIESYFQFMYPMKPGMASDLRRWEKLITQIRLPF
jgi:predicted nucleotidyltransferase